MLVPTLASRTSCARGLCAVDSGMRLDSAQARAKFAAAPVARLATADRSGRPHVVPCTFAVDAEGWIVTGVDSKPKSSPRLRRLRNIAENPRVSLLADHYADDWIQLWWARADGTATIEETGAEHSGHWELLRARYPQYSGQVLTGPVIVVTVESWTGWEFRSSGLAG
jgi:PPOX class probable F420-dependent enzyme